MPKCNFNKVAKDGCSPVNLMYILRTPFNKNTSSALVLCCYAIVILLLINILFILGHRQPSPDCKLCGTPARP